MAYRVQETPFKEICSGQPSSANIQRYTPTPSRYDHEQVQAGHAVTCAMPKPAKAHSRAACSGQRRPLILRHRLPPNESTATKDATPTQTLPQTTRHGTSWEYGVRTTAPTHVSMICMLPPWIADFSSCCIWYDLSTACW